MSYIKPPLIAAVATILILGYALILQPVIGMADNGDFVRVIEGQGIYNPDRDQHDEYFDYFVREYAQYVHYNENKSNVFTSQVLLIQIAKGLNNLFTSDRGTFDIRFLGAIHILYFALAVFFITEYLTYELKRGVGRYCIAGLCLLIFCDLAYTAYFNSFYAEGLVFISFIFIVACALLLAKRRFSPYVLMILILLNGLMLTCAKQQNAPQGFLLGIFLILLPFVLSGRKKRMDDIQDRKAQIIRSRGFRSFAIASGVSLCLCGTMVYMFIPREFVDINQYHAMTRGVLMTSNNPEGTLDTFSIDRQFALLSGTIYFERYPPIKVDSETLTDSFYSQYDFFSIASYYLSHPDKLLKMMDLAAKNAYSTRPEYVGNFERSAGRQPGEKTMLLTLASYIKYETAPRTAGFIIIWTLVALALSWKARGRTWILAFCILTGISQLGVSIIGAGDADLSKHVFLYNVAFDLVNLIGLSALITRVDLNLQTRMAQRQAARQARAAEQQIVIDA